MERLKESLLESIIENMDEGIVVCDVDGNIIYMNDPSAKRAQVEFKQTNIPIQEWVNDWECYHLDGSTLIEQENIPLLKVLRGESVKEEKIRVKQQGHSPQFLSISGKRLYSESGQLLGAMIVTHDITERKTLEEKIDHILKHDELTNLPNDHFFNEHLNKSIDKAKQDSAIIAVMYFDLDNFGEINDLGRNTGDLLIKQFGIRLLSCIPQDGMVSRQGSDEFALYVRLGSMEQITEWVEKILRTINFPFMLANHEISITASVGISIYPLDSTDGSALVRNAEIAMYHAKEMNKNNYQFYSVGMKFGNTPKFIIANHLQKALENDEFILHYQPKFDLKSKNIVAFEVLIRWSHPEFGMVSPAEFIPFAERTDLIIPIGHWVMNKAIKQLKSWHQKFKKPLSVCINISSRQFLQHDLVDNIAIAIEQNKIAPEYVHLEITESVAMHHIDYCINKINQLQKMGIKLSLDDFGIGYSSMGYLKKLPVNFIKIDKSFIDGVVHDNYDAAIVRAIISVAHSLNLKVVAEGVENQQQFDFLRSEKCDLAQGYFLSRPLPEDQVDELLQSLGCN